MTKDTIKARIFEIKRFAVHDGPGIRTTVFFKGCPLSCIWCHNPEGIKSQKELAYIEQKCVNCLSCLNDVFSCITGAIKIYGEEIGINDLMEKVLADREFYETSNGGISCSGGEPLSQIDFLTTFLKACKNEDLQTAVDTSGYTAWENMERAAKYTDLFLYDLKHMDGNKHRELCGVENTLILENLLKLSDYASGIEVRIPVIPGINDDEKNIEETIAVLQKLKNLKLVRPLPYHALSGTKYESIGLKSSIPAQSGTERERAAYVADCLKKASLPCADVY